VIAALTRKPRMSDGPETTFATLRRQVAADRGSVKQALRGQVERLRFLDDATLELARRIREPYRWVTGVNLGEVLKLVAPVYGLMKGEPTEAMIASTYWRKREPPPSLMDPDRDQCGLLWCAAILPATGGHAAEVAGIVNGIFSRHPFEPATTMSMVTERSLSCVVSVMYDRETSGEDDRAMSCYRALFNAWMEAGYYPYRLGIQAMDDLPREDSGHSAFVSQLKMALDPNLLLAPGRYD